MRLDMDEESGNVRDAWADWHHAEGEADYDHHLYPADHDQLEGSEGSQFDPNDHIPED